MHTFYREKKVAKNLDPSVIFKETAKKIIAQ
jgi:hypothetical protein